MTPLYTIIIPHYDIPDLLMRCLRSIPVREDVQVIVVDDCSPGAETYLERYPELSSPYLEFYHTPQGGSAGRARNVGLEHARGRWLMFADADDFFDAALPQLFDVYAQRDEDLIYFRTRSVLSDDITQAARRSEWLDVLWEDYARIRDPRMLCGRCPVLWGKLFRRELVEQYHIRCDVTRYSNDFWFSANASLRARKVAVVDAVLYVATVRTGSLANNMNAKPGELAERAEVCFRVEALLLANGLFTQPYEPFNVYLPQLFDSPQHRPLYHRYFRMMPSIGYPRRLALRQMCHHAGRMRKLRVWMVSYLRLAFDTVLGTSACRIDDL